MLTFKELNRANTERNQLLFSDIDKNWVLSDWTNALAGESGELCNKVKKVRRGEEVPLEDLEEELADVVIYADLIANKLGTTLAKCIINKFNKKSKLWSCSIMLKNDEVKK